MNFLFIGFIFFLFIHFSQALTCFGISSNDPMVCSGRGSCESLDTCICSDSNYGGAQCDVSLSYPITYYITIGIVAAFSFFVVIALTYLGLYYYCLLKEDVDGFFRKLKRTLKRNTE